MAKMEIPYRKVGDIYLPNLTRDEKQGELTRFGRMRQDYLREHQKIDYSILRMTGKLMEHLLDVQEQAKTQMETLVAQMAKAQGVTEELKEKDAMEWVGRMNNIRHAAEEIVKKEIIYRSVETRVCCGYV